MLAHEVPTNLSDIINNMDHSIAIAAVEHTPT